MDSIIVNKVTAGSIAEEAGIEPGDAIILINGQTVNDIFDYRFLITEESVVVELQKPDGETWEIDIEKEEYEDLGIEFADPMLDKSKSCTNKCIFCFIDQLPKGMRETLYFKDDDSRLSFLMGNYVTLTNMSDYDIDRIIRYRMSPINVSVHTTNPDLRIFMLKNRFAGDILKKLRKLIVGGITINCQIVLCRGINDENELDRTIEDLSGLYPGVNSISIVPVGLTRYREGLFDLLPYDRESSRCVIEQVEEWQKSLTVQHGSNIVYLADEFYLMAEKPIPCYEQYEDFPQIENGVGLIALMKQEFDDYIKEVAASCNNARHISIATGVSAYRFICEMAKTLEEKCSCLQVDIYEIKNDFFGENVTVAGLLTGADIISQLKGKQLGSELLITKSMLKADEEVFLDNLSINDVERALAIKIVTVENNGRDFVHKVLNIQGSQYCREG